MSVFQLSTFNSIVVRFNILKESDAISLEREKKQSHVCLKAKGLLKG